MTEINEKEIEHRFEAISQFDPGPDVTAHDIERVRKRLTEPITEQKTKTQKTWRIIMKSRKTKLTAAAAIVIIGSLFIPLNGTNVFGHIIKNATGTLTRLRNLVLNENLPEPEHVQRQIDKSVRILTSCRVYTSSGISSLEHFLNERGINFLPVAFGNAKYAKIPSDKADALQAFLKSQSDYKSVTSLNTLAYAGQEAMLAVLEVAGVAITATEDENKQLNLDVAFDNGQDGFELTQIKLNNGQALLVSGIATGQDEGTDKIMTILLLPEVMHDK